jgi:two-component system, chemotaxis family, chemotaxis protein CheY
MADVLAERGYEVLEAANGNEAVTIARTRGPSLILLDLMMPVMDGWEFLRLRTGDPALASIPVVVLTAQRDPTLPDDLGIVDVFTKPPLMEVLIALIERVCQAR